MSLFSRVMMMPEKEIYHFGVELLFMSKGRDINCFLEKYAALLQILFFRCA